MYTASSSFSATKCTTPELFICAAGPPSASAVTTSPVTCLITEGPVMNICACLVWMMKSVSAGLYTAPPAQGPQISEICGTVPLSITLLKNTRAVAAQRVNAFLDARSARIVDEDERRAGLQRRLHHLHAFVGVNLARRSACHRKVLARQVHQASVNPRASGHHAVGRKLFPFHPKQRCAVLRKRPNLLERVRVHQLFHPLARRQLALLVLFFNALFAAAVFHRRALFAQRLRCALPSSSSSAVLE